MEPCATPCAGRLFSSDFLLKKILAFASARERNSRVFARLPRVCRAFRRCFASLLGEEEAGGAMLAAAVEDSLYRSNLQLHLPCARDYTRRLHNRLLRITTEGALSAERLCEDLMTTAFELIYDEAASLPQLLLKAAAGVAYTAALRNKFKFEVYRRGFYESDFDFIPRSLSVVRAEVRNVAARVMHTASRRSRAQAAARAREVARMVAHTVATYLGPSAAPTRSVIMWCGLQVEFKLNLPNTARGCTGLPAALSILCIRWLSATNSVDFPALRILAALDMSRTSHENYAAAIRTLFTLPPGRSVSPRECDILLCMMAAVQEALHRSGAEDSAGNLKETVLRDILMSCWSYYSAATLLYDIPRPLALCLGWEGSAGMLRGLYALWDRRCKSPDCGKWRTLL